MRVRSVIRYADHAVAQDLDASSGTELVLPAMTGTPGVQPVSHEIWLIARNPRGQQVLSSYALGP